jgi:threonine dehydratase
VVAITSGANINFERLRLVSELANVGALTEATLTTSIPERPGAFKQFINAVVNATAQGNNGKEALVNVTEFKYR